jgi:subtilisin family serine protease
MPGADGNQFQHLRLALHHRGPAKVFPGGKTRWSEVSLRNLADKARHIKSLRGDLNRMRAMWQRMQADRVAQSLPPLPNAMPVFLQVDPEGFDIDQLNAFGIELVMEHEQGFLLCASRGTDLQAFEAKLNEFSMRSDRTSVARIHAVEINNRQRSDLVVGSSLRARFASSDGGDPVVDISVVLTTYGVRKLSDEPSATKFSDIQAYGRAIARWRPKLVSAMQHWTLTFVERVRDFVSFVQRSHGQVLDRQDIQFFLAAQPERLRVLAALNEDRLTALSTVLHRPCTVLVRHGAGGSASVGAQGEVLVHVPVTGLPSLPPEPQFEQFDSNRDAYETAWDAWLIACGQIRAEQWIPMLDELRTEVLDAVMQVGGNVRSVTGDDLDRLQAPDQVVLTVRLPLSQAKALCEAYPHIAHIGLLPTVADGETVPAVEPDPDVPAVLAPPAGAPAICLVDSGIQGDHPIIGAAVDRARCVSFVPGDGRGDYDPVANDGHGTVVAGAICFPDGMPLDRSVQATTWLQCVRVLGSNNQMPAGCGAEMMTWKAIRYAARTWNTKIFNLSLNYDDAMESHAGAQMDAWSAHLDWITANEDVLVVASAGNIKPVQFSVQRQNLRLRGARQYPETMAQEPCRLTPPALSWNAIVVGSVCPESLPLSAQPRVGRPEQPSPFSRGGPGLWGTIKPDVVEVGGDWVEAVNPLAPPEDDPGVMIQLPRSMYHAGFPKGPALGTSFAAPKVARVAAEVARAVPGAPPLLMRTLVLHSARWPTWLDQITDAEKAAWIAHIGFGVPSVERATSNDLYRVTYITSGYDRLRAGEVHAWTIPINPEIRRDHNIRVRIDVTTCCCPTPRPTRRGRRYGSLWVDWKASGRNQDVSAFLEKWAKDVVADDGAESGSNLRWTLGAQDNHGLVAGVSGSVGSVHRDWAELAADELPSDQFGIAVRGHAGWDQHPDSSVPYALAVTFTVIGQEIPIYNLQAQAQVPIPVQAEVDVRIPR